MSEFLIGIIVGWLMGTALIAILSDDGEIR